jgi:hypothetical protein
MRAAIPLFGEPGPLAEVRHPFVLLAGVIDDGREARAWVARRLAEALH